MLSSAATARRSAGEARDDQILDAAIAVLAEVGYDRLTMDAVAARARAGKATLYRRWASKAELVVDAVGRVDADGALLAPDTDTGTLRGDLLGLCCEGVGATDERILSVVSGLMTAMRRDPDLAATFKERFLSPRQERMRRVFERARARGEIRDDADLDLLGQIIPGQIFYCMFAGTGQIDPGLVVSVVDGLVLPAAMRCPHDRAIPPAAGASPPTTSSSPGAAQLATAS